MSDDESGDTEREPPVANLAFREWALALEDGVLLGQRCRDCGIVVGTPKRVCSRCGGRTLETVRLPSSGVVHSETTVHVPPSGRDGGYQVAVVDLEDASVLVRVEGDVSIGDTVEYDRTERADGYPFAVFREST